MVHSDLVHQGRNGECHTHGLYIWPVCVACSGLSQESKHVPCTQVVELPPVELVSNGTILAQDIKACDEKVDIWALGVTLFELLTGRHTLACIPVSDLG